MQGGDGGLAFNRAKALGILGRIEEANKAYVDAAHDTFGKDLSSFAKVGSMRHACVHAVRAHEFERGM